MEAGNGSVNENRMNDILSVGLVLCVICAIAALGLGIVNAFAGSKIEENKRMAERSAIAELAGSGHAGEAARNEAGTVRSIVPVYLEEGGTKASSYVLTLRAEGGYAGPIELIASYLPSGEFLKGRVTGSRETPGLGKKAEKSEYMRKFEGRGGDAAHPIPRTKEMLEAIASKKGTQPQEGSAALIDPFSRFLAWMFGNGKADTPDSVTGATITFTAIANALIEGSEYVKNLREVKDEAGDDSPIRTEAQQPAIQPAPTDYTEQVTSEPVPDAGIQAVEPVPDQEIGDQSQSGGEP